MEVSTYGLPSPVRPPALLLCLSDAAHHCDILAQMVPWHAPGKGHLAWPVAYQIHAGCLLGSKSIQVELQCYSYCILISHLGHFIAASLLRISHKKQAGVQGYIFMFTIGSHIPYKLILCKVLNPPPSLEDELFV